MTRLTTLPETASWAAQIASRSANTCGYSCRLLGGQFPGLQGAFLCALRLIT